MSPHTIIRAADWHLSKDTQDGAPQGSLYEAECTTCGAQSGVTEGQRLPAEMWALKHTGKHPLHRSFRAVQTTFWRITPAEGNPYREVPSDL